MNCAPSRLVLILALMAVFACQALFASPFVPDGKGVAWPVGEAASLEEIQVVDDDPDGAAVAAVAARTKTLSGPGAGLAVAFVAASMPAIRSLAEAPRGTGPPAFFS